MIPSQNFLKQLQRILRILELRIAKFGDNAPPALLIKIEDYEEAINLTRQSIEGEISRAEWQKALEPLLLDDDIMRSGQMVPRDGCPTVQTPTNFTGRQQEMEELRGLFFNDNHRVVAIHATGGMGKTSLTQAFCDFVQDDFPVTFWVDITETPKQLGELLKNWGKYISDEYKLPDLSFEHIADHLRSRLEVFIQNRCNGPVLIVFDDVWDNDQCREAVRILQRAAPKEACYLITTRQQTVVEEFGGRRYPLLQLSDADARQFLNKRIQEVQMDEAAVTRLINILRGHPLALEVAAATLSLKYSSVEKTLDYYEDKIKHGTPLEKDTPDDIRRRIYVVFRRSYEALPKEVHSKFRKLGVLAPDVLWGQDLVEIVWELEDAKKYLDTLRLHALISDGGESEDSEIYWYRQHRVLRSYALTLLKTEDAEEHRSAEVAYGSYAFRTALRLRKRSVNFAKLQPHLLAGIEIMSRPEVDKLDSAVKTQILIDTHLGSLGAYKLILEQHENLLKKNKDEETRIHQLLSMGNAHVMQGRYDEALKKYKEAGELAGATERHEVFSAIFGGFSTVDAKKGNIDKAILNYKTAIHGAQEANNPSLEAKWLDGLATCYYRLGETGKAREFYIQAQELTEDENFLERERLPVRATGKLNIGNCDLRQGKLQQALQSYETALDTGLENIHHEAICRSNIGYTYIQLGNDQLADQHFNEALEICRQFGLLRVEMQVLHNQAEGFLNNQAYERAAESAQQALTISQMLDMKSSSGRVSITLAWALLFLGKVDEAYKSAHIGAIQSDPIDLPFGQLLESIALLKKSSDTVTKSFEETKQNARNLIKKDTLNYWVHYVYIAALYGSIISRKQNLDRRIRDAIATLLTLDTPATAFARFNSLMHTMTDEPNQVVLANLQNLLSKK